MRQTRTTSNVNRVPDIAVMVAGMHRARTSLTAQILGALGVNMGDRQLGPNQFNPQGHGEDVDFFTFNVKVLRAAGGDWIHLPYPLDVEQVFDWFKPRIKYLVDWKVHHYHKWGFKDPRLCVTGRLIWPYLPDPKLLVVPTRDSTEIADSLDRRARAVGSPSEEELEQSPTLWLRLINDYEMHRKKLIRMAGDNIVYIDTGNLVRSPETALPEVEKLVQWVGGNPVAGLRKIMFKGESDA